ncbi:putative nucleotidyltransferase [Pseudomonas sp. GM78]|uniref:nucleotidyltransferase domain-containing protein n=1 Tax=Pseudomonas sp. GM78 TaxID=1144337 RepID=UPI0002707A19|nr:nucleotidyltransferase domain-containing protein [Pseudomonas sp. GM78]EJN29843.1 putative nucleotidyltransferase [Pseudomonas sp. GM78]
MSNFKAYLFGSVARGDHDPMSDTDVLLVYDKVPDIQIQAYAKAQVLSAMLVNCAFAEYSSDHLKRMFKEGHLFAWHLHLEALPLPRLEICEDDLHTFPFPAPYTGGLVDSANFNTLLKSVMQSVMLGSKSPVYEAGIAYVALRNIGMALSSSILGRPCFNRYAPFYVSAHLQLAPPCSKELYQTLIAARHASQRGLPAPPIATERLRDGLQSACKWAQNIIEVTRENSCS